MIRACRSGCAETRKAASEAVGVLFCSYRHPLLARVLRHRCCIQRPDRSPTSRSWNEVLPNFTFARLYLACACSCGKSLYEFLQLLDFLFPRFYILELALADIAATVQLTDDDLRAAFCAST